MVATSGDDEKSGLDSEHFQKEISDILQQTEEKIAASVDSFQSQIQEITSEPVYKGEPQRFLSIYYQEIKQCKGIHRKLACIMGFPIGYVIGKAIANAFVSAVEDMAAEYVQQAQAYTKK